jgi:pyruvate formate lyase activating enzyme
VTVEQVLAELLKDRAFYEKSGGGVTLSGGEPTFQVAFAEALLRSLKEQGISTALDTCGLCTRDTLERLLPYTDLVLFDLKVLDPVAHRQLTGASNQQILENLDYLREALPGRYPATALWIRTPLIPGATNADANLTAIGRHLAGCLDGTLARWELCAFNNLCRDQYTRLGLQWAYAGTPLMTPAELAHCEKIAKASGLPPELVLATGATRQVELN